MLHVKIMSNDNTPDSDTRKGFKIIQCSESFGFDRRENESLLYLADEHGDVFITYKFSGNAYVMQDGKTIATYSH